MIYVDSSVALSRLLFETRAPAIEFWLQRLASSRLLEYEIWNRLHAYERDGSNDPAARRLLMGIELYEMERQVLARALEPWPTPLRILDALHLATADYLRQQGEPIELASYDHQLIAASRAIGIPVTAL